MVVNYPLKLLVLSNNFLPITRLYCFPVASPLFSSSPQPVYAPGLAPLLVRLRHGALLV
jgi:hypothetical protein